MRDSHLSINKSLGMRLKIITKALRLCQHDSREISRNKPLTRDGYPHSAQKKYDERRLRDHRDVALNNVIEYIQLVSRTNISLKACTNYNT